MIIILLSLIVLGNFGHSAKHLKDEEKCKEIEMGAQEQICDEEEEVECGLCHTMYIKECTIRMDKTNKPINIKTCFTVQGDNNCKEGYTRTCRTLYSAECGTKWQYKEIEEDRPVCGVQMVGKCKGISKEGTNSSRGCVEIPVMRCQIEKRTVRKRMPRTSCTRIPRQFCRKTKCKPKKTKCFYKVHMISELTPVETCGYSPKKICHETEGPNKKCKTIKRQVCKPNNVIKKICKVTNTEDTGDDTNSVDTGDNTNTVDTGNNVKVKVTHGRYFKHFDSDGKELNNTRAVENVQINKDNIEYAASTAHTKLKRPLLIKNGERFNTHNTKNYVNETNYKKDVV